MTCKNIQSTSVCPESSQTHKREKIEIPTYQYHNEYTIQTGTHIHL